jgi:hypothetical protein
MSAHAAGVCRLDEAAREENAQLRKLAEGAHGAATRVVWYRAQSASSNLTPTSWKRAADPGPSPAYLAKDVTVDGVCVSVRVIHAGCLVEAERFLDTVCKHIVVVA